jgi:hypothetical protein
MRMRRAIEHAAASLLCASVLSACASEGAKAPSSLEQAEKLPAKEGIPVLTRILMNALPGDAKTWSRLLSEQTVVVTEEGRIQDKQKLLESFAPFQSGVSGSIDVGDLQISEHGDTAIAVFRSFEKEIFYGQPIQVNYLTTHTWCREGGLWRLVAAHTMVTPRDPSPIPADTKELESFSGVYQLTPERRYFVERRGDALYGGYELEKLRPLIAVGRNVFTDYGAGVGDLRIFVDRPPGTVDRMIHREKSADVAWLRVGALKPSAAAVKP